MKMGTFKEMKNHLLLGLSLLAIVGHGNARKSVHPASPFCNLLPDTLECNYEGVEEPVTLDKLEGEVGKQVKKVIIHNTKQLTISGTPCVSLHLDGIVDATFIIAHICHNVDGLSLKLTDSRVNTVPKYIEYLDIERSRADWLVNDKGFKSLSVVDSRIGTIKIGHPLDDGVIAKFENTKIDTVEDLKLEGQAQLIMVNTTIRKMMAKSIDLTNASVKLEILDIKATESSAIILRSKSTVSLKDVDGEISLSGPMELPGKFPSPGEAHAPGVPPPEIRPRRPRSDSSPWVWIIPTIVATLEAMFIMVNCTNWFPAMKGGHKHRTIEEGARLSNSSGNQYDQDGQSSVYFGSEAYNQSVNKRKSGKNF